ncbi:MAG: hypothetical protein ACI9YB_001976 [Halioglobus sp.]|jgi:hypothetical protein
MSIVSESSALNSSSSYYLSCVDRICENSADRTTVKNLSESSVRNFCRWRGNQRQEGRNLSVFLELLRKAVDQDGNCQLDQSILSRISDWSGVLNEQNLVHLNKIFSHPENVTACFIKYSGCLQREYYGNDTTKEILSSFSGLLDRGGDQELYNPDQFLPYDQGGKEQLKDLLQGGSRPLAQGAQRPLSFSEILKDPEYADVFSEEVIPYLARIFSGTVGGR